MQYIKRRFEWVYIVSIEVRKSVNRLVLCDDTLLPGRLGVWLPRNHLGGEHVLLEEALLDELFQVSSEGLTMDDLVPFAVLVRAVLLRPSSEGLGWIGFGRLTHG